ncbi:MAG: glycosyltransferase [Lachnospiraceae bacterium]|nr:glycosyltransferase [Lachnospiraceae bacterium]
MPQVSICIPTYNNEKTIADTLDSVWNQKFSPIEIIVCDDCSKDNTWDVLQEYKNTHPDTKKRRLKLLKNPENLGMAGNWNRCLSLCSGEYIKLLCADDILREDCLKKEINILEHHKDAVLVSSDTVFIDEEENEKGMYHRYPRGGMIHGKEAVLFSIYTRDFLGAPLANTFRREAYEFIGGFDPDFSYIIDYDFFIRMYCHGMVYILHEPLNYFRIREDSNTGEVLAGEKGSAYVKEHEKLLKKHERLLNLNGAKQGISVGIRKTMNVLGGIYLSLTLPGKG